MWKASMCEQYGGTAVEKDCVCVCVCVCSQSHLFISFWKCVNLLHCLCMCLVCPCVWFPLKKTNKLHASYEKQCASTSTYRLNKLPEYYEFWLSRFVLYTMYSRYFCKEIDWEVSKQLIFTRVCGNL